MNVSECFLCVHRSRIFHVSLTQLISILISTLLMADAKTYLNWFRQKGSLKNPGELSQNHRPGPMTGPQA